MNRIEILEAVRRFGFHVKSTLAGKIQIKGIGYAMTEAETIQWIETRSQTHCHECGRPLEKGKK